MLNEDRRRANAEDNLRRRGYRQKHKSEKCRKKHFLHGCWMLLKANPVLSDSSLPPNVTAFEKNSCASRKFYPFLAIFMTA